MGNPNVSKVTHHLEVDTRGTKRVATIYTGHQVDVDHHEYSEDAINELIETAKRYLSNGTADSVRITHDPNGFFRDE